MIIKPYYGVSRSFKVRILSDPFWEIFWVSELELMVENGNLDQVLSDNYTDNSILTNIFNPSPGKLQVHQQGPPVMQLQAQNSKGSWPIMTTISCFLSPAPYHFSC